MLINQIKSDALIARKVRKTDTATLLTTLYSEASMTDQEVLQVIEKFVKNANEIKDILLKNNKDTYNITSEIITLSRYLPKKMTQEELESVIKIIANSCGFGQKSPKLMGQVMGVLKEKYCGLYDGKLTSEIVKKELSN